MTRTLKGIAVFLLLSGSNLAWAVDYKFNGFVSVVGGQVVSGERERFIDASFTLRYEVSASNAIKLQVDKLSDESVAEFVGDTTMVTVDYDMVF